MSDQMMTVVFAFPARSTDCDPITSLEQLCFCDCMMDFCLKDEEKAILANLLPSLWTFQDCLGITT
jgi:hypothetical protein